MSNAQIQELEILIRARYPVIYVVTWEESRVEEALAQIARRREKKLYLWSAARGIQQHGTPLDAKRNDGGLTDPNAALDHVLYSMENAVFAFRDLHRFLDEAPCHTTVVRRVRELANYLKNSYKTLVIIAPTLRLPLDLQKDVSVLEFDLPDAGELGAMLDQTLIEVNEATGRDLKVETSAEWQKK